MTGKHSSITRRWVYNTLCVIAVVLLGLVAVTLVLFKEQYYEAVRLTLNSRATGMVQSFFGLSETDSDEAFNLRAKAYVESFNDKSIMEVWVIDRHGNVVVSSSGFSVAGEVYPDYDAAKMSKTGKADWIGKTQSGERVMALTYMLSGAPGETQGAVRYIISLQDIDRQLQTVFVLLLLLALVIFSFVTVSGMFFIRSIVNPVKRINETALRIAQGDFSVRVEKQEYEDEIGQLCDTINHMARELNETNRLKNEFISTISHELRTPLTAIKGWGETVMDTPCADTQLTEKGLRVIVSEAERLTELVEELLDFSRMESGNLPLRMDTFDLFSALAEVIMAFNERALREGICFVAELPSVPAEVYGDRNRMKQIFFNILDNAFKYAAPQGNVFVKAKVTDLKQAEVVICDDGCGISQADLPHITEKFYKANTSVRGSGIGLAVVSELVERHGGTLRFESKQGMGTTVFVTLPMTNTASGTNAEPKGE